MVSTVSPSGQVTLPQSVLDRLNLRPGSAVAFEVAPDGRVVLTKAVEDEPHQRFERLRGCAGRGPTTDQVMRITRGEDGQDAG